jgi:hypothetical protein
LKGPEGLYPAGATNRIQDMNKMIGSRNSGMSTDQSAQSPKRAAMYVRMSTDHQKYSTENQADTIRE